MTTSEKPDDLRLSGEVTAEQDLPLRLRFMRWLGHRPWAPRGTDRLLRLLHNPDAGKHFPFEVDFFGKRYQGDLAHYIDWTIFCYGAAPRSELYVLRDVASYIAAQKQRPLTFFDVGANVGHHSLYMSGVVANVVSFEPFPVAQAQFRHNIGLNSLTNVQLIPVGLGEEDQDLTYFPASGANSGVGTFVEFIAPTGAEAQTLPVRHGDTLLDGQTLPPIDILKVDVEGFEAHVFRGLRRHIHQDRPAVMTELLESTRKVFGSEANFRDCFPPGAVFAEIDGRSLQSQSYRVKPFHYETTEEVLILPPEYAAFIQSRLS